MKTLKRFITLILLVLNLISCKKEAVKHKLKFEVVIIQNCDNCYADYFSVNCKPNYKDEPPKMHASLTQTGYVWTYEYWSLKEGDNVYFSVVPTGSGYLYRMNVYIDNVLVSFRECYGTSGSIIVDSWGLNNIEQDVPVINFTFYN